MLVAKRGQEAADSHWPDRRQDADPQRRLLEQLEVPGHRQRCVPLAGQPPQVRADHQGRDRDRAAVHRREGAPVRYIRSTFVPESGACMCLFEAASADAVKRVNERAKLPFDRIVEALDLTP
jgi:hypothetical protein